MMTPEYRAAVKAAADRIALTESQRATLALLLNPRAMLTEAVRHHPDLPVGIRREVVPDDR